MATKSIAKIKQFVDGFSKKKFRVGIDVHKKDYHIALRRFDNQIETWVATDAPALVAEQLLSLGCARFGNCPCFFL